MREEAMAQIEAALNGGESEEPDISEQPTGEHPALPPTPDQAPVPSDLQEKPDDEQPELQPGAKEQKEPVYQSILTGAKTRIEALPTPKGIVFPLLLLLVAFFVIVPINGKTRFQWFWEVLTGNAKLVEQARRVGGEQVQTPLVTAAPPVIGFQTTIVGNQPAFTTTALLQERLSHVQELF